MKGQVETPVFGTEYHYVDLLADELVILIKYRGGEMDRLSHERGLVFHDYESARYVAECLIERIKTITQG